MSLGIFLIAPACPIEKVALWLDLFFVTLQFKTSKSVAMSLPELEIKPGTSVPNPSKLSITPSAHPALMYNHATYHAGPLF